MSLSNNNAQRFALNPDTYVYQSVSSRLCPWWSLICNWLQNLRTQPRSRIVHALPARSAVGAVGPMFWPLFTLPSLLTCFVQKSLLWGGEGAVLRVGFEGGTGRYRLWARLTFDMAVFVGISAPSFTIINFHKIASLMNHGLKTCIFTIGLIDLSRKTSFILRAC